VYIEYIIFNSVSTKIYIKNEKNIKFSDISDLEEIKVYKKSHYGNKNGKCYEKFSFFRQKNRKCI
jgi:hypothetical protein